MLQKVFIPSGAESQFSAKLAKHAIERKLSPGSSIKVEIIPDTPVYNDISLARFSAPERMAYTDQALAIDPHIFAIQDISPLLNLDLGDDRVAACKGKDGWDTSVMLVDATKLKDWRMNDFMRALEAKQVDTEAILNLSIEPDVLELPRMWNSVEKLTPETKLLHLTNPHTYPWRNGIVTEEAQPKRTLFGLELGRLEKFFSPKPITLGKHPDKRVEAFFTDLYTSAYKAGVIDDTLIINEIAAKRVRPDMLTLVKAR